MLRVLTRLQQGGEVGFRVGTDFLRLLQEPVRPQPGNELVIGWHMFGTGGETTLRLAAGVYGHLFPVVEDGDQALGGTNTHLLAH